MTFYHCQGHLPLLCLCHLLVGPQLAEKNPKDLPLLHGREHVRDRDHGHDRDDDHDYYVQLSFCLNE